MVMEKPENFKEKGVIVIAECPSCGCRFQVKRGRPKSEINVQNVIVRLREDLSVEKTAKYLKCSKSTIYLKLRNIGIDPYCWIDIYASDDNGETWKFLSRAGETGWGNGNPPAMIHLSDGRLLLAYGNREHRQVITRFSSDEGGIWGPEIILREGIDQDFGYPRMVQNKDGNIVVIYYCAESPTSEKYIEATIWNPGDADKWGQPIDISSK